MGDRVAGVRERAHRGGVGPLVEWAAPAGLDEHRAWPVAHLAEHPRDGIRAAYEQLLSEAGSHATRHEVLVTVTVRCAKVRVHKRDRHDRLVSAVSALVGEVKLFAERLEGAHLLVSAPLSPAE